MLEPWNTVRSHQFFQFLSKLRFLWLTYNSIHASSFINLKSLHELRRDGNLLSAFPWEGLKDMPRLCTLGLHNNRLSSLPAHTTVCPFFYQNKLLCRSKCTHERWTYCNIADSLTCRFFTPHIRKHLCLIQTPTNVTLWYIFQCKWQLWCKKYKTKLLLLLLWLLLLVIHIAITDIHQTIIGVQARPETQAQKTTKTVHRGNPTLGVFIEYMQGRWSGPGGEWVRGWVGSSASWGRAGRGGGPGWGGGRAGWGREVEGPGLGIQQNCTRERCRH